MLVLGKILVESQVALKNKGNIRRRAIPLCSGVELVAAVTVPGWFTWSHLALPGWHP